MLTLTDGGHGVSDNRVVDPWFRLHVWVHDLRVLSKVIFEGVALPTSLGFDDVEGHPPKKIL